MFCIEAKESFFFLRSSRNTEEKKAGKGREKQKNNVSHMLQNAKNKHGSKQKQYCGNNI